MKLLSLLSLVLALVIVYVSAAPVPGTSSAGKKKCPKNCNELCKASIKGDGGDASCEGVKSENGKCVWNVGGDEITKELEDCDETKEEKDEDKEKEKPPSDGEGDEPPEEEGEDPPEEEGDDPPEDEGDDPPEDEGDDPPEDEGGDD